MNGAPVLCRTPVCTTPVTRIPDALRGLWRSCDTGGGDTEVARSLAVNFVGVAAADGEAELRDAVERLQHRTPCRAFLLLIDDDAPGDSADVAATTRLTGSRHDIVLEEIVLRLPTAAFDRVPGLVRPLLVNDLPNHLFWATTWPRRERTFDELAALCDHAVVDSRRFAEPAAELPRLADRRAAGARITDLGWLRLRPWRRALAEAYERAPQVAGTATTVRIGHGPDALPAAMLLGAWLEERLGATVTRTAGGARGRSCPTHVALRAGADELVLEAPDQHIVVHVTTADHCYLPFTVPTSRAADGDLLAAAIDLG